MDKPFAITLDPGSSLANHTGSWRTTRPVYVDRLPPCNHACPAGENIQAWLFHAESGDYEAAWRELVKNNPLPAIMGRVCYHPCETACNRGSLDESVSIHAVERFLGDEATRRGWQVEAGAPGQHAAELCQVVAGARCLALLCDSVTTDHISPAGDIAKDGPAGIDPSFLFQFDESLAYINLGDCGVMYVFDGDITWQCH